MTLAKRERYIAILTAAIMAIFFLDHFLVTPYFDHRARLDVERQNFTEELARSRDLLERQKKLAPQWEEMLKSGFKTEGASAENDALKALESWAGESGLALSSLKPERNVRRGQWRETVFQVVCAGSMNAVSRFLWRVESTSLSMKIDNLQLAAHKEGSDDLTLQVRIAVLYPVTGESWKTAAESPITGEVKR